MICLEWWLPQQLEIFTVSLQVYDFMLMSKHLSYRSILGFFQKKKNVCQSCKAICLYDEFTLVDEVGLVVSWPCEEVQNLHRNRPF